MVASRFGSSGASLLFPLSLLLLLDSPRQRNRVYDYYDRHDHIRRHHVGPVVRILHWRPPLLRRAGW
jgi:hypothetical protein